MHSQRHFLWFLALGLFWGVSPSAYKHLANIGMPVVHTIFVTGIGVGGLMWAIAALQGRGRIPWALHRYGMICSLLMNIPFATNLYLAGHVPPTDLAIIITTSPFFNYLLALVTGWEQATPRRLMAIAAGFTSTLVLIISRDSMLTGQISWWHVISLSVPMLYCFYNAYAAKAWPKNADTIQVGAAESIWSGLWVLPVLLWFAFLGAAGQPALASYWMLIFLVMMWVIERIAYFTLIRDKGAVYTVQATYVATPAAVVIAGLFFGGTQDVWLWVSLVLLMMALWLNNERTPAVVASTRPETAG